MKKKWAKIVLKEISEYQKVLHWYEKFGSNIYYYYLNYKKFITQKPIPMHLVYLTNTQCTLRCKECHSYMPYITKEHQYMVDFETFKVEIDKLLKSVALVPNFRLQGGEALLVKDLPKMIEYVCSKKQIHHIQVISNGTILPSQELLDAMSNPKVLLSLSDYSCNKDIADKLKYKEILELCDKNGVNAKYWITKAGDLWIGRNSICNTDINDKEMAIKNLAACHCFNEPKVVMFFKGKFYICPPAAYFANTNPEFKIPEDDVVDIVNTPQSLLTQKLKNFLNKKYFYLCSRCNAYENRDVKSQPGIQLK